MAAGQEAGSGNTHQAFFIFYFRATFQHIVRSSSGWILGLKNNWYIVIL